ncbi:hypothetical protein AB0C84_08665 [Actinomadura sp. NPDC048955]|uniref:hypothetical protein n=1 Tax=Actinomadura sp. NPDC048955 TaxID=3158228 RepID=UPI0033DB009E
MSTTLRESAVFIAIPSSFGPDGPPSSDTAGDRWHRSDAPGGSLRDQVLASLKPAFGRDRNCWGCCVVAVSAEVGASERRIDA